MTVRTLASIGALLLAAACGGGGTPTGPAAAPRRGTSAVAGVVFYDHNGNGTPDPDERVRLPPVRS